MIGLLQAPIASYASSIEAAPAKPAIVPYTDFDDEDLVDEKLAKITKEEIIARARKMFPELQKEHLVAAQLVESAFHPAWYLWWSVQNSTDHLFMIYLDSVSGELVAGSDYPSDVKPAYYPAAITEAEAAKAAERFIRKVTPSMKATDKLKLTGGMASDQALFSPIQYTYRIQHYINGVPILDGLASTSITIDGNGRVTSYSGIRLQAKDSSVWKPKISPAQAINQLYHDLKLELAYIPDDDKQYRLGYLPVQGIGLLDPDTGKYSKDPGTGDLLDHLGTAIQTIPANYSAFKSVGPRFTPNKGGLLTEQQLIAKIKNMIPDFPFSTLEPSIRHSSAKFWDFYWSTYTPDDKQITLSVMINPSTGQLLWLETNFTRKTTKLTAEQTKNKAVEWVTRLYPDAANTLKRIESNSNSVFGFQQFYKSIPIQASTVEISMDEGGQLMKYNDMTVKEAGQLKQLSLLHNKISLDEALKKFRSSLTTQLEYVPIMESGNINNLKEIKPYYISAVNGDYYSGNYMVNAVSGNIENRYLYLRKPAKQAVLPSDAKKHPVSKGLNVLFTFGVLKPEKDGLLHPDKLIKVGDWMNMMLAGFHPYSYSKLSKAPYFSDVPATSPYASAADFFIVNSWIASKPTEALHPEQTLTRQKLAAWVIKMLDKDKLAPYAKIDSSVLNLKDVSQMDDKKAASIAIKLGLLTPENGRWNPNAPVTRVQAGSVMLRLLPLLNSGKIALIPKALMQ